MTVGTDLEPVLDWDDIQGNVLAGFNKDHQTLIGFKFGAGAAGVAQAKQFLVALAPKITSLHEVVGFKVERRRRILASGAEPADMRATWIAAAFSFPGLVALTPDGNQFTDQEFRDGLASSSPRLGDPIRSTSSWKTGGPGNVPDLLLIVAADQEPDGRQAVDAIVTAAAGFGLTVTYEETGHDLSFYSNAGHTFPSGHEQFGFKDGVSQPGIRGILPDGTPLTPRVLPHDSDDDNPEFADVGKPLVCTASSSWDMPSRSTTSRGWRGSPARSGPIPMRSRPRGARTGHSWSSGDFTRMSAPSATSSRTPPRRSIGQTCPRTGWPPSWSADGPAVPP